MHKFTKLTPTLRREVYQGWLTGKKSLRQLANQYHVDKNVVATVLLRGKIGDFTVHDSTNHRYRTIEYGLRRLAAVEQQLQVKIAKREKRNRRYEHQSPGEMVHGDTKRLPAIARPDKFRQTLVKSQVLYVAIDDYSRFLIADIMPDRTMWSSSIFLQTTALRLPMPIETHYSDNGGEYKGNSTHAFVAGCARLGIEQRFTRSNHPWTNGKAERVIKTLMTEWFRPNRRQFSTVADMKKSLYDYVDRYNHERPHQSLNNLTPAQRLAQYYTKSGDNA
jgi:transposase InsO family protein